MANFLCTTCGTQFAESASPPPACPICEDERQYLRTTGQGWTTAEQVRRTHRNSLRAKEPGLIGIGVEPSFGIGQRALLLCRAGGNVLWDCVPLLDDALAEAIRALGGITAIAISHPHYYANMVDWSRAFGGVPIYLHAADRQWVMRPDDAIVFWEGETRVLGVGLTLIRCGGHFAGGTVLHWAGGAGGRGALLSGDIIQVPADRKRVSFMWSYPNYLPLDAAAVRAIVTAVAPYPFEPIYGAFWDRVISQGGSDVVRASARHYLRLIGAADTL